MSWISVKDKMPEPLKNVLGYCQSWDRPYICFTSRTIEGKSGYWVSSVNFSKITHWMPLPEPPKGEE